MSANKTKLIKGIQLKKVLLAPLVTASFSECTLVEVGTFTFMQYKNDSLSLSLKSRPKRVEEIEPCVMLSEPNRILH